MPSESAPKPTDIYVRGQRVDIGLRVMTFDETGFEFVGRPRTHTRAILCHMTGAENPPAAVYNNMSRHAVYGKRQPLSVHFVVDQKGVIYQMADAEMRGAHAIGKGGERSANGWSIGIEFIGRGADWKKVPARGFHRPRATEVLHGVETTYEELFPAQIHAGVRLCEALCRLYNLPLRVPEDAHGGVFLRELGDDAYDTFRGVLGHLHVEPGKVDPGAGILRAVQARGRAASKPVA